MINNTELQNALTNLKKITYKKDMADKYLITIYKAAQAYADLPSKIESLVRYELAKGNDKRALLYLNDVLKLLKTEEKQ